MITYLTIQPTHTDLYGISGTPSWQILQSGHERAVSKTEGARSTQVVLLPLATAILVVLLMSTACSALGASGSINLS
jgi:hypothetical protein